MTLAMRSAASRAGGVALVLALALAAAPARAEPPSSTQRADALFAEGRALMESGNLEPACAKLEQSFQLVPRLGTMLNLGACVERRGQLSRALGIYERAATMAREAGRPDREKAARELAAAVEARVGKLLLVVEQPAPGLVVDVDGEPVPTRGDLVALDPGERKITARAPGRRSWSAVVTSRAGNEVRVVVPQLAEDTPAPAAAAAPAPAPAAPRVAAAPGGSSNEPPASPARAPAAIAAFAVGAIGVGIGAAFGLRAISKHDQSNAHCDASGCDDTGLALVSSAKSAGTVSTIAFAAGGAGLLAGALVLVLVPARSSSATVGVHGGGHGDVGVDARVTF